MITFNPKDFFLKDIEKVDICIDYAGEKRLYSMEKLENGKYGYSASGEYTNFFFKIGNKTYCKHKLEYGIISTMSSGKSTFLNALVGRDMMPSENRACTNKIFKLDSAFEKQQEIISIKKEGKKKRFLLEKEKIEELNKDEELERIDLQVRFWNIDNNISFYDTPGVNSFLNPKHREITYNLLREAKIKNYIYILNATQIGTNDDSYFLIDLNTLKEEKDINILFILNKIDKIESDREGKEEIIENVRRYLEKNNFKNYSIFPLSAYLAKLIRKALGNCIESRAEASDLNLYYTESEIEENFEIDEYIEVRGKKFSKNKLLKMLEESGIIEIEKAIQNINNFDITYSLRIS